MRALVAFAVALAACAGPELPADEPLPDTGDKADAPPIRVKLSEAVYSRGYTVQCDALLWCDIDLAFTPLDEDVKALARQYWQAHPDENRIALPFAHVTAFSNGENVGEWDVTGYARHGQGDAIVVMQGYYETWVRQNIHFATSAHAKVRVQVDLAAELGSLPAVAMDLVYRHW